MTHFINLTQFQDTPFCIRGITPPIDVWTETDGSIVKEIKVHFFRDELEDVYYMDDPLTCSNILAIVNKYWNCDDIDILKGRKIVPSFIETKDNGLAHVRVGFKCMYMCAYMRAYVCMGGWVTPRSILTNFMAVPINCKDYF